MSTGAWLALMSLPAMGPRRLWEIAAASDPVSEWRRISSGGRPASFPADEAQRAAWRAAAHHLDPGALAAAHEAAGITTTAHGHPGHRSLELRDPHVPPVLLWRRRADPGEHRPPTVGVIGTRRASRAGLDIAREFGRDLAAAGCVVASGLALGVDAAAHRGALDVPGSAPLGVVGSGLDVVYPRANRDLWIAVADRGALCSEYPLGTAPAAWRFPARNRILVALCDAVVVVESHERGGSLITAGIAGERGVPVLAVPGAIRSATSVGTNRLIADGCQPCLGVDDVLDALGLSSAPTLPFGDGPAGSSPGHSGLAPVPLSASAAQLLDALGWSPRTVDELADACPSMSLGTLAVAVAEVLASGAVIEADGRLERVR